MSALVDPTTGEVVALRGPSHLRHVPGTQGPAAVHGAGL
jgi:hypothetical protein